MYHDTLIFRQKDITLTPFRHKRHMQFLTSAPNFMVAGGGSADAMTWPSGAAVSGMLTTWYVNSCD